MIYLQHNHDVSLKYFAEVLQNKIKAIATIYNVSEIKALANRNDIVSVVSANLKDDINKIIEQMKKRDDDLFPKFILAKSNVITPASYGLAQQRYNQYENIRIVNKEDAEDWHDLKGVWFEYDMPIQLIILTKTGYASRELQLEMMRILYEMKEVYYSLRVYDDTVPNDFYVLDDFGSVNIYGFENTPFGTQPDVNGVTPAMLDFTMKEAYFKLESSDVFRKMEIQPTVT